MDELRAATKNLQQKIADAIKPQEDKIAELKAKLEEEDITSVDEREAMYDTIDALKKEIDEIIKKTLDEILPEAFAIVKNTARRFATNEKVEATATQYDRDLSTICPHITIEGDKAIWSNTWIAGGNPTTWDMIHYDVQLIGGTILHQGKIAEMATGDSPFRIEGESVDTRKLDEILEKLEVMVSLRETREELEEKGMATPSLLDLVEEFKLVNI